MVVEHEVTEATREIADGLIAFIESEVAPLEARNAHVLGSERTRYQEDGTLVEEVRELRRTVRMKSAKAGFYTMLGAEELGGGGLDARAVAHIQERMNHHNGPKSGLRDVVLPSPFTNGLSPVLLHLAPAVRERYIDDIRSGARTMCFGLSEPDAGSDVLAMRTRAVRDGDHWVLNGTKQWITNAAYADYAMIFAVTDPEAARERKGGITGFFVDTTTPGFNVDSVIPLMGHLGGDAGIISLSDVQVPADHVLGEVDHGLKVAMGGVGAGRMSMGAKCVGLAQWALDKALEYSQQRRTFGKSLAEHQMIQAHLAEMAMSIYATKNMVRHCSWLIDHGHDPVKEISIIKASATEMLFNVYDRAIQVHGAIGLTNELGLEAGLRMARVMRIPDGSAEIQRRTIARRLLAGDRAL